MSLSGKLHSAEATAANASAHDANFAVPNTLAEPGQHERTVRFQSISDRELQFAQVCTDFVGACVAMPLALLLLGVLSTKPVNSFDRLGANLQTDCLFPIAAIAAMGIGGMYRVTHRRLQPSAFLEMRELSFGVGSGCVLALAAGAVLHVAAGLNEPNPTQLVLAVIVTVAVISVVRTVMRFFLHALASTRVLVVGSGPVVERIMTSVRLDPGMTLVGRVTDSDLIESGALGSLDELDRLCRQHDVHRVLVACPDQISHSAIHIYRRLQESVHVAMVPQFFELVSWRSRLTDLAGMPFVEVARPHLSLWDQFMKRAFDLIISSAVLIVSAPLLLVVAIGVKLSSPGPCFFRQVRIGRHQLPFTITKFRTMRVLENSVNQPSRSEAKDESRPLHELRGKHDEIDRITPFGAFLRRTSIDEIPQFLSVFKGDMSVVGPRPFVPEESGIEGWGSRRYDVRPGITGLWQVSGRNDLTRNDLLQLDYLYVASWSLWWDLKIMWETPKTMARGTGAY